MFNISYQKLRENIIESKQVWLFFTANESLFSEWIRLWTQQNVSHVGFLIYLWWRLWTVEMMLNEWCAMIPASTRLFQEKIVKVGCLLDIEMNDELIESILDSVGKVHYDLWWAFLSLFVDTKSSKQFCSEFVSWKLKLEFPSLERWIFPWDVMNKCNISYNLILE